MKLTAYIAFIGDEAAAELFGISNRTAMSYRLGERKPRPEVAERIVLKTSGKVGWRDIYAPDNSKTEDTA